MKKNAALKNGLIGTGHRNTKLFFKNSGRG
jgi:hypothetical protein